MANYDLIQHTELRLLVAASESIHTLPEGEIQSMVERIAGLPDEGVHQMIAALRDERQQVTAAKLAKGITPEIEREQLDARMKKVYEIRKKFEGTVRKENENAEKSETEKKAEDLLNNIPEA